MPTYMYGCVIILAFFYTLTAVLAFFEKRLVWPYGPCEEQRQFPDIDGYAQSAAYQLSQLGFKFMGWCADIKGPTYKISYGMMVSADGRHLAVVGAGSMLNIRVRGTTLYTRTVDGRTYTTTDTNNSERDLSGTSRNQYVQAFSQELLLKAHEAWLQEVQATVLPFTPGRELDQLHALREERCRILHSKGMIRYVDSNSNAWKYTFFGGVRFSLILNSVGLLKGLTFGKIPKRW